MNAAFIEYFRQFFSILWDFLLSPVPVLGLPWLALFGGPLLITLILGSLDKILGFSVPSIADTLIGSAGSKDTVTLKQFKEQYGAPKDKVDNNKHSISYYAHMRTYNKGGH